jgi:hypothetical protein
MNMIIWQGISITNMLTLPGTTNGPRFTFEDLNTKETDSFLLPLRVSYLHHTPYAHDLQALHQLPTVTAKFMKQHITQSQEHYINSVHSKLLSFDVLVDFYQFLFNFIPINIHTYNLLNITAMMTSTVVNMEDTQTSHLPQTQKWHVVTANVYQTGCLLPNPTYIPFIHKSKRQTNIIMCVKAKICNATAYKARDDCTQL